MLTASSYSALLDFLNSVLNPRVGRIMQQSMYSPTHPTAGQPGGYHGVYLGVCCLFKPLGCGGFLKFCPQIGITGFVYIENHSDYSSDCYKIKVLILQNIEAVMFKFNGGVDVRQPYMFKVMGGGAGASAMFKVMGGSAGASATFKVMGGSEGRQPCSR